MKKCSSAVSFHHRKHLGAGDGPGGREQSGIKLVNTAGKTFDHRPEMGLMALFPAAVFLVAVFLVIFGIFILLAELVEKREIKPRRLRQPPHKGATFKKSRLEQGKAQATHQIWCAACFYLEEATDMCISENYVKYQRS